MIYAGEIGSVSIIPNRKMVPDLFMVSGRTGAQRCSATGHLCPIKSAVSMSLPSIVSPGTALKPSKPADLSFFMI